jgi:hypothetical protein
MQPTVSSFLTPLALKTAGTVLILSSIVDLLFILRFPPDGLDLSDGNRWWLFATSQLVDRGLLPLVGIAFVVAGDWIKIVSTEHGGDKGNGWRIATFSLASLLGAIFILVIPFQILTTNDFRSQEIKSIDTKVAEYKQRIESTLKQIGSQSPEKIKEQLKQDIASIDRDIKSGKVPVEVQAQAQAQKVKLEAMLSDPKKISQESEQNLQKLQQDKQKATNIADERMLKTGIRTSIASLLLALGYIAIGWTGLRRVLR